MQTLYIKNILICIGAALFFAFTPANDFKTDLLKMQQFYQKNPCFSKQVSVEVIDATNGKSFSEVVTGQVIRSNNLYYNTFDNKETVVNEKYYLVIDHTAKRIICDKPNAFVQQDITANYTSMLDTVLKQIKVSFLRNDGSVKWYAFKGTTNDPFTKAEIGLHKDGYLHSMVYHYPQDEEEPASIIRITYTQVKTNVSFPKGKFSEKKYIVHNGKTISPAAAYKNYKIINKLLNK